MFRTLSIGLFLNPPRLIRLGVISAVFFVLLTELSRRFAFTWGATPDWLLELGAMILSVLGTILGGYSKQLLKPGDRPRDTSLGTDRVKPVCRAFLFVRLTALCVGATIALGTVALASFVSSSAGNLDAVMTGNQIKLAIVTCLVSVGSGAYAEGLLQLEKTR